MVILDFFIHLRNIKSENIKLKTNIMKKLFYLLLCLPLAFAACEKQPTPEPTPEPTPTTEIVLAKSTIEATAEGGRYEVSYTIENPVEGHNLFVAKSSDYAWISDFGAEGNIIYVVVEANDTDNAREAVVEVSYGEKHSNENFKALTIKQAANKGEEPEDGVVFEAQILTGEYYGEYYNPEAGNYYIFFTDYGFNENGNMLTNSTYYKLDLYGELYEGEAVNGYIPLPAGTYTLDANDTTAVGTIGASYSGYIKTNNSDVEIEVSYEAAELVVNEDGSCLLTATINGQKHTVTFSGESTIADKREVNGAVDTIERQMDFAYAFYYGDQYSEDVSDNFYFFLSDIGVDENGWEIANGTYYRFDLYSEILNTEEGVSIPYGTYTFDATNSFAPNTVGVANSMYYVLDDMGYDYVDQAAITGGVIIVDEEGVRAEVMVGATKHILTYYGEVAPIFEYSSGGGGSGDGPYSTLYDDWYCNLSNHNCLYMYYGDYYEVGYQNWTFGIMPKDGAGDFVQFDVLAAADSVDSFYGEYIISDSYESYTAYPGYIDSAGYMSGSWYYTDDGVTMAPFVDGYLSVVDNGDGTAFIEFDVYDDCGFNVTGSWTGVLTAYQQATPMKCSAKVAPKKAASKKVLGEGAKVTKADIAKF